MFRVLFLEIFFFLFLFLFLHYMISTIPVKHNLCTIAWFQVLLSKTNYYMISSNNFYLMIIICLHTFIWFGGLVIYLMAYQTFFVI